ncbi:MAG TPA: isoaspartyl peptidase/L-asparaginase [Steroidobacteraceae bacterium]|nr:isoaspartyl peptidase/L-asparaginase [Steroidobacteraceae bacterium]
MIRRLASLAMLGALVALATLAHAESDWVLVIHGGAGVIERSKMTPGQEQAVRDALQRSLARGAEVLSRGGTALDAVEQAVRVLEDDPLFNAGRGAVFTAQGANELDAAIMDGRTRRAGAVAGVTRTRNPVSLARAVMEKSPHVMLAGAGADEFSKEQGLEQVNPRYFFTIQRWLELQEFLHPAAGDDRKSSVQPLVVDSVHGTVGAVALDRSGHLAAATSTGGLTGKRWGRVGDSPIVGAGTYADDRACAVSATGSGEYYIREGVAHEICARIRFLKETPQQAADAVQAETQALGGDGGVIVLGKDGSSAWSFNTIGMYRGKVSASSGPQVAIYAQE